MGVGLLYYDDTIYWPPAWAGFGCLIVDQCVPLAVLKSLHSSLELKLAGRLVS